MATFENVIEAIKTGKKFKLEGWYDGQWIEWLNKEKHLMLSPKQLLSDQWLIENNAGTPQQSIKRKP